MGRSYYIPISIWYETMPALLKAWFERVLAHGFAHNILEGKVNDQGFLNGKRQCYLSQQVVKRKAFTMISLTRIKLNYSSCN